MNRDGGGAGDGGYLPRPFTTLFESADRAMKDNEIGDPHRVAVAVAIDMLESFKECRPLECHVFVLVNEIQSSSANVHQHERHVVGRRAAPPSRDSIKNPLFHFLR